MASKAGPRPPRLNAFDIGCVVVGGIIGVGIFFTPWQVAQRVDDAGQMIVAWALGGLLALLGALVFVDLSRLAPGHGGTFIYLHRAFGPRPAFLYGWANWLVIQAGALCVVGLVMVQYLVVGVLGRGAALPIAAQVAIAALAIAAFTLLNALGLHVGRRVQNTLTVTKTLAVFLLVVLALLASGSGPVEAQSAERSPRGWLPALSAAMLPVLFSFGGWQQGSFVAGAARQPLRDVPLGIFGGVVVVVLAYITVNLSFLDLLGFERAAGSATIAEDAIRAALAPYGHGAFAGRAFSLIVVVSALGIMNTICMAPPFVLHAMAREGLFFRVVGRLDPRFGTPTVGVVMQGSWAIALLALAYLATGQRSTAMLNGLVDGVVFVDWLFFGLCGGALVRLRRRGDPGVALVPGGAVIGALFLLLALAVAAGAVWTRPQPSLGGLAVCLAGLPFCLRSRARPANAQRL
jgi:APA family basic amino acid/polyamine antiporter